MAFVSYCSSKDVDDKAIVKFWLQSHTPSTEPPPSFESWNSDYTLLPHLGVGPVCWEPGGGHHCERPSLVVNGLTHVHTGTE